MVKIILKLFQYKIYGLGCQQIDGFEKGNPYGDYGEGEGEPPPMFSNVP